MSGRDALRPGLRRAVAAARSRSSSFAIGAGHFIRTQKPGVGHACVRPAPARLAEFAREEVEHVILGGYAFAYHAPPDRRAEPRQRLQARSTHPAGPDDHKRVKATLARLEGSPAALVPVAESPLLDARCTSPWDASSFIAVVRPARAPEFRTLKPDATCDPR